MHTHTPTLLTHTHAHTHFPPPTHTHHVANQRTIHFAWSIMVSFDIVQVLGSHQNVFTLKLIEGKFTAYRTQYVQYAQRVLPTGLFIAFAAFLNLYFPLISIIYGVI
jgi:hypothetical protein